MPKTRLEAFSDGVLAIIITIMVLELKVPHGEDLSVAAAAAAGFLQLRAELRLYRHLLEQPSPHAACREARHRRRALGQPASVVLAVAVSVRHRLDGREPFCATADGALRRRAADGGDRLLDSRRHDHPGRGPGLASGQGGRQGSQGQTIGRRLCRGDRALLLLQSMGRPGDIHSGRAGVAGARQSGSSGYCRR